MSTGIAPEATIGERIRWYRQGSGRSQAVLAGLVGRTPNWLSKVERDEIPVDRLSVLIDLARALHLRDLSDLTGKSFSLAPDGLPEHDAVAGIRLALSRPPSLLASTAPGAPLSVSELTDRVARAWTMYETARRRYAILGPELPGLLADAIRTSRTVSDELEQKAALRQLVSTYHLIQMFVRRLGERNLARVAADRSMLTAEDVGDPLLIATAAWNVSGPLLGSPHVGQALEMNLQTMERLRAHVQDEPTPVALSAYGALHLTALIAAARVGQESRAWNLLHGAAKIAQALPDGANHTKAYFNTTNVAMHAVHLYVECGEAAEAFRAARDVTLLDGVPLERLTRYRVEQTQAARLTRDWDAALESLLTIEQESPEELRYHVLIRETLREMLAKPPKGRRQEVQRLAEDAGVL
ncbi:helix-turn-helix transcriptional regulator [Myceligenerans halotolerans]